MRIDRDKLSTLDLDWFGVDRRGNIALFSTGGNAFVPEYVLDDKERTDKIFELICKLPDRPQKVLNRDVYNQEFVNKGLFCYESRALPNEFNEFYQLKAVPDKPLNFNNLSEEIRTLMGIEKLPKENIEIRRGLYLGDITDFSETPQIIVPEWERLSEEELHNVPKYLWDSVFMVTRYKTATHINLRCSCGCHKYKLYRNVLSKEEKIQNHRRIFLFWKKQISIPEMPICMRVQRVEAICCDCGKQIIVFDNRFNGPDAIEENEDEALRIFQPTMKAVANDVRVAIKLEDDEDGVPESFSEITINAVYPFKVEKVLEYEM